MKPSAVNLTRAFIHTDRLTHNLAIIQQQVGNRPLWPAIKANAYGHGMEIVARHLVGLGYNTLCVAHVGEAIRLAEAGIEARWLLLSATLPEHSEAIVRYGCEPALCTLEMAQALSGTAQKLGRVVAVHLMVDTGMGRIGVYPAEAADFLERCQALPGLRVRGLMSHFPCADEADQSLSRQEIEQFRRVIEATDKYDIEVRHMANSAAIFSLPDAHFDAVRPGIALYGLTPSREMHHPQLQALQAVLEWKTRVTFLKEVPPDTGLSYGHAFHTRQASLIATLPVGYGDGLSRNLSNQFAILIGGRRCPQVGRITMDQCLVDVTALRGRVGLGDEAVIIGNQGTEQVSADELAGLLGTINYEVVTAISQRVPRIEVSG